MALRLDPTVQLWSATDEANFETPSDPLEHRVHVETDIHLWFHRKVAYFPGSGGHLIGLNQQPTGIHGGEHEYSQDADLSRIQDAIQVTLCQDNP